MKDDREFKVGQPKKPEQSALLKIAEIFALSVFGLMAVASVIKWIVTSPCDRANQDLAKLEEKRSAWLKGGDQDMLQATYEDLQKAERDSRGYCTK